MPRESGAKVVNLQRRSATGCNPGSKKREQNVSIAISQFSQNKRKHLE
jgi:hypothetical protein